ncbi:relaxase/mobilization nuclease [Streptomyces sp. NPDC004682]
MDRPVSAEEVLGEYAVVARWPTFLGDELRAWTSAQWADFLGVPYLEHPLAAGPGGDRRAILHLEVWLHPDERDLDGPEWAEVAHRLARAAGIEEPGEEHGCRWIAVQMQPDRLDLITNLIRLDGTWHLLPADVLRRLSEECRRIEQDLRLIRGRNAPDSRTTQPVPTASGQLAAVLTQLADEQDSPLASARRLIEQTGHRIARRPGTAGINSVHCLEMLAQCLRSVQEELDTMTRQLIVSVRPGVTLTPPPARHVTHRSL